MPVPVTYIAVRMAHHSPHAGYDRLADYISSTVQQPNSLHRLMSRLPERVLARLRAGAGSWYNSAAFLRELQTAVDMLRRGKGICHFLYGEDGFHYTGYLRLRRSYKLVATYHMPPDKFHAITPDTRHLRTLDAVVIVAQNQERVFKDIVRPERVHLIPHGVDTLFFNPGSGTPQRLRQCLFVGSHLRDFRMLRETIMHVAGKDSEASFCVVTHPDNLKQLSGLPRTTYAAGIREQRLLELYRTASVLLLPLHNCTANNTMLEALACGLPCVATDAGGIRMYGQGGGVVFVPPGDAVAMAREALCVLDDARHREALSRAGRTNAERFDWTRVAAQMRQLYEELCH